MRKVNVAVVGVTGVVGEVMLRSSSRVISPSIRCTTGVRTKGKSAVSWETACCSGFK